MKKLASCYRSDGQAQEALKVYQYLASKNPKDKKIKLYILNKAFLWKCISKKLFKETERKRTMVRGCYFKEGRICKGNLVYAWT